MLLRCRGRVSAFAAQLHIVLSLLSVLSLGVGGFLSLRLFEVDSGVGLRRQKLISY